MLASHVLIMVVAVTIAVRDRSFAVVPNYYQRGINWDAEQAVVRSSARLGWHVDVQAADEVDPVGRRAVRFNVTDSAGHALPGAVIELEYFHDAHGDEDRTVNLTPDPSDPTQFSAVLPMRYAGEWEFHFTITAGKQTYVGKQNLTLSNAGRRPA
jgi:nitrogen fixation protein FixH